MATSMMRRIRGDWPLVLCAYQRDRGKRQRSYAVNLIDAES